MLSYDESLQVIYATLRAHKRHDEYIWSTVDDLTEAIIARAETLQERFPSRFRSYDFHIKKYRRLNKKTKSANGVYFNKKFVQFTRLGRKRFKMDMDDRMVELYGAPIVLAEHQLARKHKIVFFAVNMANNYTGHLVDQLPMTKKIDPIQYITAATLYTVFHERRHAIQNYLLEETGSFMAYRPGSSFKKVRTRECVGRYVNRKRETEMDANVWASLQAAWLLKYDWQKKE